MTTKVSFDVNGLGYIDEDNGTHSFDIDSVLGHRFRIIDGLAQDIYNGVSDNEVRRLDHLKAQQERQEKIANGEEVEALPPLKFEGDI
jgi:hypothetical protein